MRDPRLSFYSLGRQVIVMLAPIRRYLANRRIRRAIASLDDLDLCYEVGRQLNRRLGCNIPLDQCRPEERTVLSVITVKDVVDNGGFERLFETDVSGDKGYVFCRHAFKTIGAEAASSALREAVSLFPGSKPPLSARKRLRLFFKVPAEVRDRVLDAFYGAEPEIYSRLATYIRANQQRLLRGR